MSFLQYFGLVLLAHAEGTAWTDHKVAVTTQHSGETVQWKAPRSLRVSASEALLGNGKSYSSRRADPDFSEPANSSASQVVSTATAAAPTINITAESPRVETSKLAPEVVGAYIIGTAAIAYTALLVRLLFSERRKYMAHNASEETNSLATAWSFFKVKKKPFFHTLTIAQDGGLSEAHTLYNSNRWFLALFRMLIAVCNICALVVPNFLDLINQPWTQNRSEDGPIVLTTSIFFIGQDREMRPRTLLAIFELLIVWSIIARVLKSFVVIICVAWLGDEGDVYRRWDAVADLLLDVLPAVSQASALRLLNFIVPAVFLQHITHCIGQCKASGKWRKPLFFFTVKRICYGIVGIDAFMIKFILAADAIRSRSGPAALVWEMVTTLVFLNQVLGITNMHTFVEKRLLLFVFGGEDCILTAHELAKMQAWRALLAQEIWKSSRSLPQFLAVMLSYTDYDFQSLTLNGQGAVNFLSRRSSQSSC